MHFGNTNFLKMHCGDSQIFIAKEKERREEEKKKKKGIVREKERGWYDLEVVALWCKGGVGTPDHSTYILE